MRLEMKARTLGCMGVVLCILLGAAAHAQPPVTFVDPNLKAAVEAALGKTDPTATDMLGLTSLSVEHKGIFDLTGLAYATNLHDLDLVGNRIGDISALVGLTQLHALDLLGNPFLCGGAYQSQIAQIIRNNPGIAIDPRVPDVSTHEPRDITETSAILSGSVVDDGELACQYRFRYWREGGPESLTVWEGALHTYDTFAERVEGLQPGRQYHFQAEVGNCAGTSSGWTWDFRTLQAGTLTLSSSAGGSVTVPGEGAFMIRFGTSLRVVAVARQGWRFLGWTGTAVEAGKVTDPNSATTTLMIDGDYSLRAQFVSALDVVCVDDDAPGDPGRGNPLLSDPDENGSPEHPFDSIQEAIDALDAAKLKVVVVLPGTYTGQGNREIDFAGKSLVLKSASGPGGCVIDCQGMGRAFNLHRGEGHDCVIDGFTIRNGLAQRGGAIYLASSSPTIKNCVVEDNYAVDRGGGVYCGTGGCPALVDCTLTDNRPEALYLEGEACDRAVAVQGTVRLMGNGLADSSDGKGKVLVEPGSTLELTDCEVGCQIIGSGALSVPVHSKGGLVEDAMVTLVSDQDPNAKGLFQCDGALYVKDNASIKDTTIHLAEGFVEGNAVLTNNRITIYPNTLSGVRVSGAAKLENNVIEASNDQYLTVDPNGFTGLFTNHHSLITISRGTVFEVRAADLPSTGQGPTSGIFQLSLVPDFNTATWTIDRLHVQAGQRLRLADRFNDQQTSPQKAEAMYVKELILDANSILDVGGTRLYYGQIQQDPSAQVVSQRLLGFSLVPLQFEDPNEHAYRVLTNNSDDPCYPRQHVTREPNGLEGGFMRMRNLLDHDPKSPTFGQIVHARTKARFAQCAESRVLVKFKYLFEIPAPNLELVVTLSDVPELLNRDDPNRALHHKEVGRVSVPTSGWPGSPGSGHYGRFEGSVSTYGLDLAAGTWVELELVEGASQSDHSVALDDLAVEVADCGGLCMNLNWDNAVNGEDFMAVMAAYGRPSGVTPDLVGNNACMEGLFSKDGYIDCYDVFSWDWALHDQSRCNVCAIPVAGVRQDSSLSVAGQPRWLSYAGLGAFSEVFSAGPAEIPGQLLILGKRGASEGPAEQKLEDRLYVFNEQGRYGGWVEMGTDRCFQRIVRDGGSLCLLNTETTVSRLREGGVLEPVVPPGRVTWPSDPRYGRAATITIGVQQDGAMVSGRPIQDAAFSGQYGYVVPVVVRPEGGQPYLVAAKLELRTSQTPPYRVVELYDDPLLAGGGQSDPNLNGIREIEVDNQGSVYVLNADSHTYSDILWAHRPDGTIQRLVLDRLGIDDPTGLCVSNSEHLVYAGCGCGDPSRSASMVYGFSTEDLSVRRKVTIQGMECVTGMAVHPRRQVVWVVGLGFRDRPLMPSPLGPAFYQAYLAVIQPEADHVEAIPLSGTDTTVGSDLALPTSILWAGF